MPNALVVPEALNELLGDRLSETNDHPFGNAQLFSFLEERASDDAFRIVTGKYPELLRRKSYVSYRIASDPKVRAHARALQLGKLPEELRRETGARLQTALFNEQDTSFLDDDLILSLMQPTTVLHLATRIRDDLLPDLPALAADVAEHADLDLDPPDNFDDLRATMRGLESLFEADERALELLAEAEDAIEVAVEQVREKRDQASEPEDDDWDWREHAPAQAIYREDASDTPARPFVPRSIFSDVDE